MLFSFLLLLGKADATLIFRTPFDADENRCKPGFCLFSRLMTTDDIRHIPDQIETDINLHFYVFMFKKVLQSFRGIGFVVLLMPICLCDNNLLTCFLLFIFHGLSGSRETEAAFPIL